jgi:indole-3-glycerol phosphate synthase
MGEVQDMKIWRAIREVKEAEVAGTRRRRTAAQFQADCAGLPAARGFAAAIRGGRRKTQPRAPHAGLQVIAEVKKASPSVGLIRADFDPVAIARAYEAGGAAAISCLTDERFFQGSLEYLRAIHAAVGLPVLRKDFLIDPIQVWEARAAGADAVLLIAGFIDWEALAGLREAARTAGLDVLLEIHGAEELERALALEPEVLGINNRNLRSDGFVTDLAVSETLAPRVPAGVTLISESGIRTRADVERLGRLGIDGILVGEHLMRHPDPGAAIAEVLGLGRRPRP